MVNTERSARTVKGIIHTVGQNMSTLNHDISLTQPMPPVELGEKGVSRFIDTLETRGFTNLAAAMKVVRAGEKRVKKGKNFPDTPSAQDFRTKSLVIRDMAEVVGNNAEILGVRMNIPDGSYNGERTRVGELVLTFYDLLLRRLNMPLDGIGTYPANHRASTLCTLDGFSPSPLMQKVNTHPQRAVREVIQS